LVEVDDELISKMVENTLRIGVYGKVEQKKRTAGIGKEGDEKLGLIGDNGPEGLQNGDGDITSKAGTTRGGFGTSRAMTAGGPLTADEIEQLRRENAELMEKIRKYQEAGLVPVNKTGCCFIF
jgi:hypothetical protein